MTFKLSLIEIINVELVDWQLEVTCRRRSGLRTYIDSIVEEIEGNN